jgi:hypothetical protein
MLTGFWLWVLLGVAGLIVVTIIVVFIVARRRFGPGGYDLTPEARAEIEIVNKNRPHGT